MSEITASGDDLLLEAESTNTKLDTLNTNVAKESKQDAANTLLGDIKTNTNGLGLGNTGAASSVGQSATSVSLLAAQSTRVSAIIRNDSNQELYIEYGATATITSSIRLKKNDTLIIDDYTGAISGIWDGAGSGNARITENTKV